MREQRPLGSTAAVRLEPLTEECAERMYRWMRDPEVADHLGLRREPSADATLAWIRRIRASEEGVGFAIRFAGRHVGNVVLDRIDRRLGNARLSVYIGESEARGRGLAREAIRRALDVAFFELDLEEVWLTVHEEHAAALRLYAGLGFEVVEVHPGEFFFRGAWFANLYMALRRWRYRRLRGPGRVTCVVLQPSYIPWRGYFHQIMKADIFVFYDDVQFDVRGWRNRNRIRGPNGSFWLTIPVRSRQLRRRGAKIDQVEIDWSRPWSRKHLKSLSSSYRHAPYFEQYAPFLEAFYGRRDPLLADFVIDFDIAIAHELGIRGTEFVRSSALRARGSRSERLLEIVREVGGNHYLSGPKAKSYLDENLFREAGVSLEYMRYDYPEYSQLFEGFDPHVSILDLLLLKGKEAPDFIRASVSGRSAIDVRGSREASLRSGRRRGRHRAAAGVVTAAVQSGGAVVPSRVVPGGRTPPKIVDSRKGPFSSRLRSRDLEG